MRFVSVLIILVYTMPTYSQSSLPYYEVPEFPEKYHAGTVAARMIDGLGFRFYWATDSIIEGDLNYKPSADARTYIETVQHIYAMSKMIVNATTGDINSRDTDDLTFEQMRKSTLLNLKKASDLLKQSENLDSMTIKYEGKDGIVEYPFWVHLNGPISDCIWHTGQLVSFRRASGNPLNSKVSFFAGKLRE